MYIYVYIWIYKFIHIYFFIYDYSYIDNLNRIYNEYFFRYDKGPLIIINTNDIDFVNNKNDLAEIIDFIKQPSEGTRYFNPIKTFK